MKRNSSKSHFNIFRQHLVIVTWIVGIATAAVMFRVQAATPEKPAIMIEGRWSFINPDHSAVENQRFTAIVDGQKYLLSVESKRPADASYLIGTCDGVDFFYTKTPLDWRVDGAIRPKIPEGVKHKQARAEVYPGVMPQGQAMLHAQALWLAVAAPMYSQLQLTNHLKTGNPLGYLLDFTLIERIPPNIRRTMEIRGEKASTGNGYREIKFFMPGKSKNEEGQDAHFKPPYDKGWLFCKYTASNFVDHAGIIVPRSFTFEEFRTKKEVENPTGNEDVRPFGTHSFEVTKVSVTEKLKEVFPPLAEGAQMYTNDRRLVGKNGKPYGFAVGVNGDFWSRNSPRFLDIQARIRGTDRRHLLSRYSFVFLCILFVPVAFLAHKHHKTHKHQQNERIA
jgi:hypothetical protein